jgi:hypothetical protein
MRTLTPTWPASDLPTLRLRETTSTHPSPADLIKSLKPEWLTLSVMDWDRGTRDDLCGRGVLSFDVLAERFEFEVRLRMVGEEQGWIRGSAELVKVDD